MEKEHLSLPDMSQDMEFLKHWLSGHLNGLSKDFTFAMAEFEKAIANNDKVPKQVDEIIRFLKDYKYIK